MIDKYQRFHTTQNGPHPSLLNIISRYAKSKFLRPIPVHQQDALREIKNFINTKDRPIILDSGCGTGLSTRSLAQANPEHLVVGIDKSVARLSRAEKCDVKNFLLVRGDFIDLWRLLASENWPIERHYVLYPNPWPKSDQVRRRIHAHPVFSTMLALAPYLELRTNWQTYAEEFVIALKTFGQNPTIVRKSDTSFITLFEKKYVETSCPIYVVTNQLIADAV